MKLTNSIPLLEKEVNITLTLGELIFLMTAWGNGTSYDLFQYIKNDFNDKISNLAIDYFKLTYDGDLYDDMKDILKEYGIEVK